MAIEKFNPKKGRGTKYKSGNMFRTNIFLPKPMANMLDEIAKNNGCSRSDLIRECCEIYLRKFLKEQEATDGTDEDRSGVVEAWG